jgi:hypothetical protein
MKTSVNEFPDTHFFPQLRDLIGQLGLQLWHMQSADGKTFPLKDDLPIIIHEQEI